MTHQRPTCSICWWGPGVGNVDMNDVQNNVKTKFWWAWSMWAGVPGLVMGSCILEIDRIVIRVVQYQFDVNRCRNEEVNVQCSIGKSVGGDTRGLDHQTGLNFHDAEIAQGVDH
ncbi:hypothetical protein DPMN_085118 [Dreissena polymorpha]|uniref:Uncharacterized protein n=1 Tax=Dreissena polymorpha TaxID=45954 RepID=A0A9D4BLK1_DREPO|nr:hypothetical protein DPMN_085118 [Dreissena polymorpha]